jgi:DNA-binding beta-propeller fold protein YncE
MLWIVAWALAASPIGVRAAPADEAENLFAAHCAVCHGADRGGYIGPALNRDSLVRLSEFQIAAKAITGGVGTLMPPHPTFFGKLSKDEINRIAAFVRNAPKADARWSLADIKGSLRVDVADEAVLPARPIYGIADIDDLMAVMGRGRYAAGKDAKIVFFDGRTHRRLGEIETGFAPHVLVYHPVLDRWAYAVNDTGDLFKIDLYSLRAVRRIRVGLNGASLAVSRDGRFVAAGSFVPNSAVILDAMTLAPVKYLSLRTQDADGRVVESDCGGIVAARFADIFAIVLEQAGEVWTVDLADPDLAVTRIPGVGRHLHDAFVSPNGRHIAVASYDDDVLAIIDLKSKQVIKRIPAGRQPHVGSGAVIEVGGRKLGVGTNIGVSAKGENFVTVFDMETFEVVKQIPVLGPTESPAAHPKAPHIVVDIVGRGPTASNIQLIDKQTLEVVRTIDVGGHSYFPEYTARGDYLYVSAGYAGDRLVVYRAGSMEKVETHAIEAPAGIFSRSRARAGVGLQRE